MDTILAKRSSPEEQELHRKQAELAGLQDTLAQRELDLVALQKEQQTFEAAYLRTVGSAFADLDALVAEIAQLLTRRHPTDAETTRRAQQTAEQSARSGDAVPEPEAPTEDVDASAELKRLFREVARRVHPDLADSEEDRVAREELMKAANDAYLRGDLDALRSVLDHWQARPEAVLGQGVAQELIRVIRAIAQVWARLRAIEREIEQITHSDLYALRLQARAKGVPWTLLLREMEAHLRTRIATIEQKLVSIVSEQRAVETGEPYQTRLDPGPADLRVAHPSRG